MVSYVDMLGASKDILVFKLPSFLALKLRLKDVKMAALVSKQHHLGADDYSPLSSPCFSSRFH